MTSQMNLARSGFSVSSRAIVSLSDECPSAGFPQMFPLVHIDVHGSPRMDPRTRWGQRVGVSQVMSRVLEIVLIIVLISELVFRPV